MSGGTAAGATLSVENSREAHLLSLLPRSAPAVVAANGKTRLLETFEACCSNTSLKLGDVSVAVSSTGFSTVASIEDEVAVAGYAAVALLCVDSGTIALVGMDHAAVQLTLAAMLGSETSGGEDTSGRPLTDAERKFAMIVAEDMHAIAAGLGIAGLADAEVRLLATALDNSEIANLQPAMKLNAAIGFGGSSGLVSLYLSMRDVDAATEMPVESADRTPGWEAALRGHIGKVRIRVAAALPPVQRTLSEVSALKPGDVIDLAAIGDTQTVFVTARNRKVFIGELGKIGRSYSVRIMQSIAGNS